MSPFYPDAYPNLLDCTWVIRAPISSHTIRLTFQNVRLGSGDYLYIHDGDNLSATKLKHLSSYTIPEQVVSSKSVILLRLTTDASRQERGFHVTYDSGTVAFGTIGLFDNINCLSVPTTGCGGFLNHTNGTVTSPHFPNHYLNHLNCIWIIKAPSSSDKIRIKFDYFRVYSSDYVYILDGDQLTSTQLGRHYGYTLPPNYVSSRNALLVRFQSGPTAQDFGFQFTFEVGKLTAFSICH